MASNLASGCRPDACQNKPADLTEFRFSNSIAQVEGELVPVAEIALAQADAVYFEHHVLLWKDEATPVTAMQTQGA